MNIFDMDVYYCHKNYAFDPTIHCAKGVEPQHYPFRQVKVPSFLTNAFLIKKWIGFDLRLGGMQYNGLARCYTGENMYKNIELKD